MLNCLDQEKDPTLVLYDLTFGNIMVSAGKFLGLLDFDCALYGHKSLDFTFLNRSLQGVVISDHFLKGYQQEGGTIPDFLEKMLLVNKLDFYLATILNYHGATDQRAHVSQEYLNKLEDFLSKHGS